jgi:hypothetical protein
MKQFKVIFSNDCNGNQKIHVIFMISNMFTDVMCAYTARTPLEWCGKILYLINIEIQFGCNYKFYLECLFVSTIWLI